MALAKIEQVTGRGVYVPGDDIDTDRIIPARYMKCVTFDGLGEFMFYDVRFDEKGNKREHPLNDPRFAGASILISGNNFGCGSSREHAPQAIYRYGFRAVIAQGFAEIFFGNSTTLSMPCVCATREDIRKITDAIAADPRTEITIDLKSQEIRFGGKTVPCTLRESARKALLAGMWDPIAELLEGGEAVEETAGKLAYMKA
jgi:3-isopropylmalate/(R)-2-methylmalate dehydratase small subunit